MHTDLFASLELIRLCAPHMKAQNWGRIVPHRQHAAGQAARTDDCLRRGEECAAQSGAELALQLAPFGDHRQQRRAGTIRTGRNADLLADLEFAGNARRRFRRIHSGTGGLRSAGVMFCAPRAVTSPVTTFFADGESISKKETTMSEDKIPRRLRTAPGRGPYDIATCAVATSSSTRRWCTIRWTPTGCRAAAWRAASIR